MQRSRSWPAVITLFADRLPVHLQRFPYRSPVLRGRFHHHFLDPFLQQPDSQSPQLFRIAPEHPSRKLILTVDLDVAHHHSKHLLVNIDPRDLVGHFVSSWPGAESMLRFT